MRHQTLLAGAAICLAIFLELVEIQANKFGRDYIHVRPRLVLKFRFVIAGRGNYVFRARPVGLP